MTASPFGYHLLKKDPLPILLERAPLAIRNRAAEHFLEEDSPVRQKLLADLYKDRQRERLIVSQQPDGLWPLAEKYTLEEQMRAMTFLQQLIRMTQMHDFSVTKEHIAAQKGLIALLKMQKPDGKFPLLLHHHGYALWLLVRFGLAGNPFVEKGFRWIAKRQRPDGGWLSPAIVPSGISLKTAKSGIWTTLMIFQAFNLHSRLRNSQTAQLAAEFVLNNFLEPNQTTLFPEPDAWNYLYTDYSESGLFRGGTLRFIEALAPNPDFQRHPKFKKALNWLLDLQFPDGLFPAIAGRSTEGDYHVTLRFISALKEIERVSNS